MPVNTQFAVLDLRRTLTHARAYCEIWWLLDGKHPERDTIIKASERYWGLFEQLPGGIFAAFIISITSIFDAGDDCISLNSIPEIVTDFAFDPLWERGRRLYKYRSKAIAHRDAQNDSVDFARVTGFTYNDLRGILKDTCDLYDRYALAQNLAPIPSPQPSSGDDLLRMIRKVAE